MKILYFHQHFSTPLGSTAIRSYQMAQKLIARGHEVTMICGSYAGGDTGLKGPFKNNKRIGVVDGIKVIELKLHYSNDDGFIRRTLVFLAFAAQSIFLALRNDYDLLFATSTPLTAGIPGIFSTWMRHKPFVFEVRDLWPELPKEMGVIKNPVILGLMNVLEWTTYKSAAALIALAPGIADGICKRGISRGKVTIIPNGCDLKIFGNKDIEPWRPKGVSKDDFIAVFTGTHGIANGLDAVLDAAAELKKRGNNHIKIILIGQGKLKSALVKRAQKENLTNVIFLNPVDKGKLAGLLAASDLGMQILANVPAFYYGTSPNKFFDYIAAGLPVLNNYPGWIANLIEEHRCGFVVEPDNPTAFADALEGAARNKEQLKKMGNAARKLAEDKFDRDMLSDQFVDWLENHSRVC